MPDLFVPERFAPENRAKIPRFAYLPFGAGARICVGMTFAMQEALLALAMIARRFRADAGRGRAGDAVRPHDLAADQRPADADQRAGLS